MGFYIPSHSQVFGSGGCFSSRTSPQIHFSLTHHPNTPTNSVPNVIPHLLGPYSANIPSLSWLCTLLCCCLRSTKSMFFDRREMGQGGQREVGEQGEDSCTWPLSCPLSSCVWLLSILGTGPWVHPRQCIPIDICISRMGGLISLVLKLDYENQLNLCFPSCQISLGLFGFIPMEVIFPHLFHCSWLGHRVSPGFFNSPTISNRGLFLSKVKPSEEGRKKGSNCWFGHAL